MTDAELSALEAAAKAATRGPWISHEQFVAENSNIPRKHIIYPERRKITRFTVGNCDTNVPWGQAVANAAYIAAANPAAILELIAKLRQVRNERDWLAENMPNSYPECHCPEGHYKSDCNPTPTAGGKVCYDCLLCWLRAAREATCQK